MQTSDPHAIFWDRAANLAICGNKPTIDRARKATFCCANLGSARNLLGSRNQTSAIRGKEATIDRARKATRPSAATNPRCREWPSCFACAIDRGFVAADGRGLVACGSEVCVRDPRIIAQSSDPRFAQQNPRMVRIRTLRITYIYIIIYISIPSHVNR